MTTEQLHNDFLKQLTSIYESREAANITDWVCENVMGFKRLERRLHRHLELDGDTLQQLQKYLAELLQHRPVQYVLNEAWFYKMKFYVNEHVLIPRPETEELVSWVVEDVRCLKHEVRFGEFKILDIGTGSGCIAIAIKKELENIDVTALDVSKEAISVADKNAGALHVKINSLLVDFLNESLWNVTGVYDVIVSNPPYIPENENEKLAKNVSAFEPGLALFVDNNRPFIFYEKIAGFAQSHLHNKGKIYVEIHEDYAKEVEQVFSDYNFKTEIKKDIYGKERMIKAVISNE